VEIHLEAEKELAKEKKENEEKKEPLFLQRVGGFFAGLLSSATWAERGIIILSVLIIAYGILPVLFRKTVFNIGSVAIIGIGAFFLCLALWLRPLLNKNNMALNIILAAVGALASVFFIMCAAVSGMMVAASNRSAPEYKTRVTVVVLGCQIKNDKPSLMLQGRLDAAYDYLAGNPEAYCVVSGGKGEDEPLAEAEVMRDYLIGRGISEKRIAAETNSANTRENLQFSAQIIDELGLYPEIIIATDRFHQYRAGKEADELGLPHYAVNRETRWYNAGHYWLREIAGIVKIGLMGSDAY
ncbi:MAG: YdcF family protein, partial [Oscillospiraceae bacterium]|nr:YdcF family protein [Oscillospiraceae bacterium]